jgi:V-type H+-transporting ATPase subunit D
MSQNRYVVVPTVTVLAVMKARLTGAVKGHALLKKKADALTVRCTPRHSTIRIS